MKLQTIENRIHEIRGENVILDFDIAEIYGVQTRVLKQGVRRNMDRFPEDFMFQLSKVEWNDVITNCDNLPKNVKFSPSSPFAFTEQGVAMLSGVLKSKTAIEVNISIMRAFMIIRKFALSHKDLNIKLSELEQKYDTPFTDVYDALSYLIEKNEKEKKQLSRQRIGYK